MLLFKLIIVGDKTCGRKPISLQEDHTISFVEEEVIKGKVDVSILNPEGDLSCKRIIGDVDADAEYLSVV